MIYFNVNDNSNSTIGRKVNSNQKNKFSWSSLRSIKHHKPQNKDDKVNSFKLKFKSFFRKTFKTQKGSGNSEQLELPIETSSEVPTFPSILTIPTQIPSVIPTENPTEFPFENPTETPTDFAFENIQPLKVPEIPASQLCQCGYCQSVAVYEMARPPKQGEILKRKIKNYCGWNKSQTFRNRINDKTKDILLDIKFKQHYFGQCIKDYFLEMVAKCKYFAHNGTIVGYNSDSESVFGRDEIQIINQSFGEQFSGGTSPSPKKDDDRTLGNKFGQQANENLDDNKVTNANHVSQETKSQKLNQDSDKSLEAEDLPPIPEDEKRRIIRRIESQRRKDKATIRAKEYVHQEYQRVVREHETTHTYRCTCEYIQIYYYKKYLVGKATKTQLMASLKREPNNVIETKLSTIDGSDPIEQLIFLLLDAAIDLVTYGDKSSQPTAHLEKKNVDKYHEIMNSEGYRAALTPSGSEITLGNNEPRTRSRIRQSYSGKTLASQEEKRSNHKSTVIDSESEMILNARKSIKNIHNDMQRSLKEKPSFTKVTDKKNTLISESKPTTIVQVPVSVNVN